MHIHKYAHLPNSLGQENELSKSSNTNLMKKKKKGGTGKKLFSKYELSGEVEQQRY